MNIEYASINDTPTTSELAAEELKAPQGIALALTSDGAKLPAAGADVLGIALVNNADTVAAKGRVDIQIRGRGLWMAGGTFSAGDLLATDDAGKAVKAKTGNFIVARAMEAATAPGDLVRVQLLNCGAKA